MSSLMKETVEEDANSFISGQSTSQMRILVVDDSVASAKTMGWALELMGYDVHIAHEGTSAQADALAFKPHVILMDLSLPGMSGYELCKLLKKEPSLSETLFVAQTGWNEPGHRRQSEEAGFVHHLVKPVDMVRLERILAKQVEKIQPNPEAK